MGQHALPIFKVKVGKKAFLRTLADVLIFGLKFVPSFHYLSLYIDPSEYFFLNVCHRFIIDKSTFGPFNG